MPHPPDHITCNLAIGACPNNCIHKLKDFAGKDLNSSWAATASGTEDQIKTMLRRNGSVVPENLADKALAQTQAALKLELTAEAKAASASRLLIEQLQIGRVSLLLDIHASQGSRRIPMAIDTHQSALNL